MRDQPGKILISPSSFGECGDEPLKRLSAAGFEVVLNPYKRRLTAAEVVELAQDCIGIVAGVEPLTAEVLAGLPRLRCISRVGVGLQNVDVQAAVQRGIEVRNTPDGPTRAVAELTVGVTLNLLRGIGRADRNMHAGTWKKEMGNLLHGKTVGIVGLGRIGRMSAELFTCLGCRVVATDPAHDQVWLQDHPIQLQKLEALLRESDIVVLHLALAPDAPPVLGERELGWMKADAFLVNMARGDAVEEHALCQALISGKIAGAALDVFAVEPYQGPLTELDQVVLTPHLGSYAREARLRMELDAVLNLLEVFADHGASSVGEQ